MAKVHTISAHGTYLTREVLEAPAFAAMSCAAQMAYIWVRLEWKGERYSNNGKIRLSVRQLSKRIGTSINTAANCFRELQAKGFIVVTEMGALGVSGMARAPAYELTEHPLPGSKVGRRLF